MRLTKEQHQNWQGADAGYEAKHKFMRKNLGKATHCELNATHLSCRFEWANLDHQYSRHTADYIQLCRSCHMRYDIGKLKIIGLTLMDRGGRPLRRVGRIWVSDTPIRNLKP